jgi:hypothetical protein
MCGWLYATEANERPPGLMTKARGLQGSKYAGCHGSFLPPSASPFSAIFQTFTTAVSPRRPQQIISLADTFAGTLFAIYRLFVFVSLLACTRTQTTFHDRQHLSGYDMGETRSSSSTRFHQVAGRSRVQAGD